MKDKSPWTWKSLPLKIKILVSTSLIIILLSGYYLAVYESYRYQSNNLFIGIITIIAILIAYPVQWIKKDISRPLLIFLKILKITLSVAVLIILVLQEKKYEGEEINRNPAFAKARVTGRETEKRKRGKSYYATIQYRYNNRTIIQRINDDDRVYTIGDTVRVRFSNKYPEMFEVTAPEDKQTDKVIFRKAE